MKYRNLRIAWSAVWGLVTVLLLVLWVWSYWRYGMIQCKSSNRAGSWGFLVCSVNGRLGGWFEFSSIAPRTWPSWNAGSWSLEEAHEGPATLRDLTHFYFNARSFAIPYWFLFLAAGALSFPSAVSQLYRFSLRTLLITTTLIAIVLGRVVWSIQ